MNYTKPDATEPPRPRKLVDFKGLKAKYGIPFSRTHLANLERQEKFPKRVSLGAHRVAWVIHEIEAWIADRIAARDGC